MSMQFAEHPAEIDMTLRRNFILVFEKQNLMIEKSPSNLVKLFGRRAIRKRNASNFSPQIGSVWPNFNL